MKESDRTQPFVEVFMRESFDGQLMDTTEVAKFNTILGHDDSKLADKS